MIFNCPRSVGRGGGGAAPNAGATSDIKKTLDLAAGAQPSPSPGVASALAAKRACGTFAKGGVREQGCRDAGFDTGLASGYPNADVLAMMLLDGPQA